jgi:endo-1,4-beta-xylanase
MSIKLRTRRDCLAGLAKAAWLGVSGTAALSKVSAFATPLNQPPAMPAVGKLIPYGALVRSEPLLSDPLYRAAVRAHCQMIAPENEMTWPELRPGRAQFRFEKVDGIVDFARASGMEIRGHALAARGAMPAWTDDIRDRADAERELVNHVETVMSRYRGVISSWDVVDAPLAEWPEDDVSFRPSIWASRLRADYLPIALRTAAAADPQARLVINEYDLEFRGPRFVARRHALIGLLRSLRDRGVPLHAVGLQAHLFADRVIDRDGLQELLAEIAKLKLDVLITELDVIDYELPGQSLERDARVADLAADFLQAVSEVVRPTAILSCGLSDRYSWVPGYFKRPDGLANRPLPFDADFKPKPLFDVIEAFRRRTASEVYAKYE